MNRHWYNQAACQGADWNLFDPVSVHDLQNPDTTERFEATVHRFCERCPVRGECAEAAVVHGDSGIRGGIYFHEGMPVNLQAPPERPPCGTEAGWEWHRLHRREPMCSACSAARRAAIAATWKPCGTPAAHRRHERNGEKPCDLCAAANRRTKHAQDRARRARKTGAA